MKKFLLETTVVIALTIPGAAFAADLPAKASAYKAPVAVPTYSWSGCYVGGHAGFAWSHESTTANIPGGPAEPLSFNPSGGIGGGQIGCEYQLTNLVFGIEGTWSGTDLNQTINSTLVIPATRTTKIDQIATVTGRLGYTWDQTLLYAKGGYAAARVDTSNFNPANGFAGDTNKWENGWIVGGGLEFMAARNIVLGVEYDYAHITFDRTITVNNGALVALTGSRGNLQQVVARASYLFNWGGPVVAKY